MAIEWKVSKLHTKTIGSVENVVTKIEWYLDKTDENNIYTRTVIQHTEVSYDPSASFIAYASLDEATIVGWIKTTLGSDCVTWWETLVNNEYTRFMSDTKTEYPDARGSYVDGIYTTESSPALPF